jgi:uncharacterized damage-inducible protein DinB
VPEAWLSGPVPGIDTVLQPAAHALVQARTELERAALDLSLDELERRPGGAASAGFHLRHIAGSIDRLLAYARGEVLSAAQRAAIPLEEAPPAPEPAAVLIERAQRAIDTALDALRATPASALYDARAVGRARLPTTVFGLLFHIAEHTMRHTGQLVTTAKVVRWLAAARGEDGIGDGDERR